MYITAKDPKIRRFAAHRRRPFARRHIPHFRRRDPFERRPRLCSAQDHPPRAAPRALLEAASPFFSEMSAAVRAEMKEAVSRIGRNRRRVARVLDEEENRFTRTVETGLRKLEERTDIRPPIQNGFKPSRLTKVSGVKTGRFMRRSMKRAASERLPRRESLPALRHLRAAARFHRGRARATLASSRLERLRRGHAGAAHPRKPPGKAPQKEVAKPVYTKLARHLQNRTRFLLRHAHERRRIEAIVTKEGAGRRNQGGAEAEIVLDRTTIYAESGGQVADTGSLYDNSESQEVAEVRGAYYPVSGLIAHRIVAKEDLRVGDRVATVADPAAPRSATCATTRRRT